MAFDNFLKMFGPREQPPEAGGLAAPAPEASGGLGGGMFGGLSRFNDSHPGFLMGAGNLIQGRDINPAILYAMGVKKERDAKAEKLGERNKTKQWLMRNRGMSEDDADAIISSGAVGNYMRPPKEAGDVNYGLTPVWGKDADGNDVLGVIGDDASLKQIETPGFTPSAGIEKVDLGTEWGFVNKRTGDLIRTEPKQNEQAARDTARGTGLGKMDAEAAAALPGVEGIASLIDSQINDLKNDPYLPDMVGPVNSRLPNISGDAARVQSRIDQLQGGAFLQARQMLKGGGAITDYEGAKAEAAFVRMNQAQSVGDFKAALDEFNAAVQMGLRKLKAQAGGGGAAPATGGGTRLRFNPQTGELE